MPVKMITTAKGAADASGAISRTYEAGEILLTELPWQKHLADLFVNAGLAEEIKVVAPTEAKARPVSEPDPVEGPSDGGDMEEPAPKRRGRKKVTKG